MKTKRINADKPHLWKADIAASVDQFNQWFMRFAPVAFRSTRVKTTEQVKSALLASDNLRTLNAAMLKANPAALSTLRMSTCPPLAVDRLIGLAGVSPNLVKCMEQEAKIPSQMPGADIDRELNKIAGIIGRMADPDIFIWLGGKETPAEPEIHRASTIVADRLCGAVANPIIRNAQEKRQLATIKSWLEARGYRQLSAGDTTRFNALQAGTFSFRMNVPVKLESGGKTINIPIDTVIMPLISKKRGFPVFIEAKSAGDFANTNKRRKEEAVKMAQLRGTYGSKMRFILFLCGYFDSGYLGYEAAEGIDWVWEHRINDLALLGI